MVDVQVKFSVEKGILWPRHMCELTVRESGFEVVRKRRYFSAFFLGLVMRRQLRIARRAIRAAAGV